MSNPYVVPGWRGCSTESSQQRFADKNHIWIFSMVPPEELHCARHWRDCVGRPERERRGCTSHKASTPGRSSPSGACQVGWKKSLLVLLFVKKVLPFSSNPNFYTTITSLIIKLINATPNDAPHATLINNLIDINTCKWWINFTIRLNFIASSYFIKYWTGAN